MKIRCFVPVAAFGLFAAFTLSATASAAPSPADRAIQPPYEYDNQLMSVDGVSPSDIWAVGSRYRGGDGTADYTTLTKHWDGDRWRTIPSFDGSGQLDSVAEGSPNDVWAVGTYSPEGRFPDTALVLHWNGSEWIQVTTPKYVGHQVLSDVSFISPTNVLIHGYYYTGEGAPVIRISLIWDGSTLHDASGAVAKISSADALSPKDAWGVGFVDPDSVHPHTYAAHWNGQTWKKTATPDPGYLTTVTEISTNDAWAGGRQSAGFFEHWDGTRWTAVDDPHSDERDEITGVSGTAPDDVWASGYDTSDGERGFLQHWDGHAWSDTAIPVGSAVESKVEDVLAFSPSDAWAVGYAHTNDFHHPWLKLLMHWDGTTWSEYVQPAF